MKLSALQKFILQQCLNHPQRSITKREVVAFYAGTQVKSKNIVNDIAKSADRLIARDLIVAYGKKTAAKWYIHRLELTPAGRRFAKELVGQQQKLPLKLKSHS